MLQQTERRGGQQKCVGSDIKEEMRRKLVNFYSRPYRVCMADPTASQNCRNIECNPSDRMEVSADQSDRQKHTPEADKRFCTNTNKKCKPLPRVCCWSCSDPNHSKTLSLYPAIEY